MVYCRHEGTHLHLNLEITPRPIQLEGGRKSHQRGQLFYLLLENYSHDAKAVTPISFCTGRRHSLNLMSVSFLPHTVSVHGLNFNSGNFPPFFFPVSWTCRHKQINKGTNKAIYEYEK